MSRGGTVASCRKRHGMKYNLDKLTLKRNVRRVIVQSTADSSGMDSGSKDGLGIPHLRGLGRNQDSPETAESTGTIWTPVQEGKIADMDNPFRDMVTTASQKLQSYLENLENDEEDTEGESEWEGWQNLMKEVEEKYSILEALQFQLDEAVEQEDFKEAAKLKAAFDACAKGDPMATSLAELERALREENYKEAARIRDQTCNDLIGWWVGQGEDTDDPFGRIVNISPLQGRLIARSYTAKHLAAAREGSPIFEVFVSREEEGAYAMQPVYLKKRLNPSIVQSARSPQPLKLDRNVRKPNRELLDRQAESDSGADEDGTVKGAKEGEKEKETQQDDGLGKILGFLKDRLSGAEGTMVVNASDIGFTPEMIRKLHELSRRRKDEDKTDSGAVRSAESTEDSASVPESTDDSGELGLGEELRATITVDVQVGEDSSASGGFHSALPQRVPGRIERRGKDEFCFHIEAGEDDESEPFVGLRDGAVPEGNVEIRTVIRGGPQGVESEVVSPDQLQVELGGAAKEKLDRLMRLALGHARRQSLSTSTRFRRIPLQQTTTDPLNGTFIAAFGARTSEVVQLTRKVGKWEGDLSDSLPYEYVEAVKLTGDPNVPAGQVTFRAKIGRQHKLTNRGPFPEELGLTARYGGQGRLADAGFKNPHWVNGELILLDGRGKDLMHGADVGFIYAVPDKNFLVLFNRLNLKPY